MEYLWSGILLSKIRCKIFIILSLLITFYHKTDANFKFIFIDSDVPGWHGTETREKYNDFNLKPGVTRADKLGLRFRWSWHTKRAGMSPDQLP